jgi:hypothetical protein
MASPRDRRPSSPLHGSVRGVLGVLGIGAAVLLAGWLIAAVATWIMT